MQSQAATSEGGLSSQHLTQSLPSLSFLFPPSRTELSQCSVLDSLFPHRGHAELAIIADLPEEAGDPGVAEGLLDRVETQLTANLFLMSECRPSDRRSAQKLPQRKKRASAVTSETMEEAEPEAHGEAQARWLGLFDQGTKKPQGAGKCKVPNSCLYVFI